MTTIGAIKEYTLDNGFTANFWRTGQVVFAYNENEPDSVETKWIRVDMVLFKDMQSMIDCKKSTGVVKNIYISYTIEELNQAGLFEVLWDRIMQNEYFIDAQRVQI